MPLTFGVYPTENNVGTVQGVQGRVLSREALHTFAWAALCEVGLPRCVLTAFTITDPGGLFVTVSSGGVALIDGFILELTSGSDTFALTASASNYVHAVLNKTGGLVTGAQITVDTNVTPPGNGVLVGRVLTNASAITAINGALVRPRSPHYATYTGDAQNARQFFLGFKPKLVYINKRTSVANAIQHSLSGLISGSAGLGLAFSSSTTYIASGSKARRAEITDWGFEIDHEATVGINLSPEVYDYLVWP